MQFLYVPSVNTQSRVYCLETPGLSVGTVTHWTVLSLHVFSNEYVESESFFCFVMATVNVSTVYLPIHPLSKLLVQCWVMGMV